ncbi:hypothetical protein [Streptomyces zaomyceticus]|uniref:hypothetical protein n=1 Tax=Streptomyces zaomyceticus TaxID=68286 RepID=UPI0033B82E56
MTVHDQWNAELQTRLNAMAKELLQIGGDCASPQELQHYLSELSSLASAIRYSVEHAAWRSLLAQGAPLDGKPVSREVQEQLRRPRQADLDHPGQAAQFSVVCDVMAGAEHLSELASSAWLVGLTEEVRREVDGAHAQVTRTNKATYQEIFGSIDRAVGSLPPQVQQAAREALSREFAGLQQRTGADTEAPQP